MRPHSFDENNSLVYIAGCIREVSCVILDRIDDSVLQINTTGIVAAEITYRLFVWWGILEWISGYDVQQFFCLLSSPADFKELLVFVRLLGECHKIHYHSSSGS